MKTLPFGVLLILCSFATQAATFGSTILESPLTVGRIYQGHTAVVYVTFLGGTMAGCVNNGGYVRSSWQAAGPINEDATDRLLSLLLMAKAQNLTLEVRYRVNSQGTGWDKCSIDAVYLY